MITLKLIQPNLILQFKARYRRKMASENPPGNALYVETPLEQSDKERDLVARKSKLGIMNQPLEVILGLHMLTRQV